MRTSLVPVKIVKVSSNDGAALVYLPVEVQKALGIRKGDKLLLLIDPRRRHLVAQKVAGAEQPLSGALRVSRGAEP